MSWSSVRRECLTIALGAALVATARTSLADHYVVPTGSMLPTVEPDDHVLVDKLAYGVRLPMWPGNAVDLAPPAPGDVVVLRSPEDGRTLLKRVVAVPGDRVTVARGELVLDGAAVPVRSLGGGDVEELGRGGHPVSLAAGGGPDFGPVVVPAGRYLVMGDNRGNSHDGRSFGFVPRDAILGRAVAVIARHGAPTWIALAR